MTRHSVNNNTSMGFVISLCLNSNHLISSIPPKMPQILDINSVVALWFAVLKRAFYLSISKTFFACQKQKCLSSICLRYACVMVRLANIVLDKLISPQSRCSYSILHLKLFNIFTKNITKRSSETAKLHQENGGQYGYRTEIFSKLGEQSL